MYDLYRYIEHVTHMCLRSWSVLYSDHLNLEIPVDIKKKYSVSKVQDVHVVSVSLSVNGDSYWKEQLFDIIVCVTWSWHYFADDRNCDCMLSLHSNFSHFIHSQNQSPLNTPVRNVAKRYVHVCMYIYYLWIHRLKN